MTFRTALDISKVKMPPLKHDGCVLLTGSCFSDNMGTCLRNAMVDAVVNPFGTTYNPLSLLECVGWLIENRQITHSELFEANGVWNHFMFHSRFSGTEPGETTAAMNISIERGHRQLSRCSHIFVTLGTSFVYRLNDNGQVVNNCHKLPAGRFKRSLCSMDEITAALDTMATRVHDFNPAAHIIFTVSPIRHLSDGAHGNQISKATLLLAIEQLQREFEICDYFPSYEIMMDDLRDYRFYDTDMAHPSTAAITYISEILTEAYLSDESRQIASQWLKIATALAHRPLNPQQTEYAVFLKNTLQKIMQFQQAYPYINVSDEIDELTTRINQL